MKKFLILLFLPLTSFAISPGESGVVHGSNPTSSCEWFWIEDRNGWDVVCSGTISFGEFISATDTNSTEECEDKKRDILDRLTEIRDKVSEAEWITYVYAYEDGFGPSSWKSFFYKLAAYQPILEKWEKDDSVPTIGINLGMWFRNTFFPDLLSTFGSDSFTAIGDNVYNYFEDPDYGLYAQMADATHLLYEVENDIADVKTMVQAIPCVSSSSNGCGGADCPCEDYWRALLDAVHNIETDAHHFREEWDKISEKVTELIQRAYYASEFRDKNDQTYDYESAIKSIWTTNGYDSTMWMKFPWLSRIEILLARLVGIGDDDVDMNEDDLSADTYDKISETDSALREFENKVQTNLWQSLMQRLESVREKVNPFHGKFSNSHVQEIELLPDISFGGSGGGGIGGSGGSEGVSQLISTFPRVTLPLYDYYDSGYSLQDILELAHHLTTFLWSILTFIFIYKMLVYLWGWGYKVMQNVITISKAYLSKR